MKRIVRLAALTVAILAAAMPLNIANAQSIEARTAAIVQAFAAFDAGIDPVQLERAARSRLENAFDFVPGRPSDRIEWLWTVALLTERSDVEGLGLSYWEQRDSPLGMTLVGVAVSVMPEFVFELTLLPGALIEDYGDGLLALLSLSDSPTGNVVDSAIALVGAEFDDREPLGVGDMLGDGTYGAVLSHEDILGPSSNLRKASGLMLMAETEDGSYLAAVLKFGDWGRQLLNESLAAWGLVP